MRHVPLIWKPIRNRSYAAMLGRHQLAFVLQHEGHTDWAWMVSACNGTECYRFQIAETLDAAKAAAQGSIDSWFDQAGLIDPTHS